MATAEMLQRLSALVDRWRERTADIEARYPDDRQVRLAVLAVRECADELAKELASI